MFLYLNYLLALGLTFVLPALTTTSIALDARSQQEQGLTSSTPVFEFSNPTWLENIAVRHNGQILVTSISTPALVQVDPSGSLQPIDVAIIPDATSLLGIVELQTDVSYLIAGNLSNVTADYLVFPSKIWSVDLRHLQTDDQGVVLHPSVLSLVADLSTSTFLNTLTTITPNDTSAILISDSGAGHVLRLDVSTGASTVVLKDYTTISPISGVAGVTGIHTHDGELYYAKFASQKFFKVAISPQGRPTGPPTLILNDTLVDDFSLSRDGKKAYAATNPRNSIIEIDIPGRTSRMLIDALNATSSALGRPNADFGSVYVVTGGGLDFPLTLPGMRGGQVIRIDL